MVFKYIKNLNLQKTARQKTPTPFFLKLNSVSFMKIMVYNIFKIFHFTKFLYFVLKKSYVFILYIFIFYLQKTNKKTARKITRTV